MYQAIKAGQVDALLQDLPVNVEHAKDGGFEIVQEYSTDEQYGLAIKKGNTALVERRQRAAEEDAQRRRVRQALQQVLLGQVTSPQVTTDA